jgi:hypothetical protein
MEEKKLMELVLVIRVWINGGEDKSEHLTLLLCFGPFVSVGEFLKNQPKRSM